MHNGVVHSLGDVQYVLNLKNNFISLGALNSNGHKIVLEGALQEILLLLASIVVTNVKKLSLKVFSDKKISPLRCHYRSVNKCIL